MILSFAYLAFVAVLRLVCRRRPDSEREVELLALRHELAVMRRTARRSRLSWADRAYLAALARMLSPQRRAELLVRPATLLRLASGTRSATLATAASTRGRQAAD